MRHEVEPLAQLGFLLARAGGDLLAQGTQAHDGGVGAVLEPVDG